MKTNKYDTIVENAEILYFSGIELKVAVNIAINLSIGREETKDVREEIRF